MLLLWWCWNKHEYWHEGLGRNWSHGVCKGESVRRAKEVSFGLEVKHFGKFIYPKLEQGGAQEWLLCCLGANKDVTVLANNCAGEWRAKSERPHCLLQAPSKLPSEIVIQPRIKVGNFSDQSLPRIPCQWPAHGSEGKGPFKSTEPPYNSHDCFSDKI